MAESESIYIVLSHSGTTVANTIKLFTRKRYSHVSIAFDKNISKMYSFGRVYKYTPVPGGFIVESFNNSFYKRFKNTEFAVYEVKVTSEQKAEVRKNVDEFEKLRKLYNYNIVGLVAAAAKIPIERKNSYFCSQFVAHILKKSGINIIDKHPSLTQPCDFISSEHVKFVYEGKASEVQLGVKYV